ncbi:MAG: response regulator [Candidatus Latescibacterota bacterium]|jgi:CheY-like chemotaxis protein
MAQLLIIDDNPQNQKYLERIIRLRTKHLLEFAASGPAGIEKIVANRPDLIFLDLFIPGIDGFELFKILRKHPATHTIPIVIHTAVPLDQLTQMRLKRVQCDAFVEFPIEASELTRIIQTALRRNSSGTRKWVPPSA